MHFFFKNIFLLRCFINLITACSIMHNYRFNAILDNIKDLSAIYFDNCVNYNADFTFY